MRDDDEVILSSCLFLAFFVKPGGSLPAAVSHSLVEDWTSAGTESPQLNELAGSGSAPLGK